MNYQVGTLANMELKTHENFVLFLVWNPGKIRKDPLRFQEDGDELYVPLEKWASGLSKLALSLPFKQVCSSL